MSVLAKAWIPVLKKFSEYPIIKPVAAFTAETA